MIVCIKENKVLLEPKNVELKKYHISQLVFYGYSVENNTYVISTHQVNEELLRIIEYFNIENIQYELCDVSKNILSNILIKNAKSEENIKNALNIKNGIIDNSNFNRFKNFLSSFPRKLKPHQVKAAYHLYSIKNGANFSVPGSGKTSVVLSVYEKLRIENKCNLIYVVGPPSCFQPWKNEFKETLGRIPESKILSGGNKQNRNHEYFSSKDTIAELYLSTFHTVQNDYKNLITFLGQKGVNASFVIDEAHYMKQIGGLWANSLLKISRYTSYRCILTGTPIPKSYTDIFNIFDFLWDEPKLLSEEDKIKIKLLEIK